MDTIVKVALFFVSGLAIHMVVGLVALAPLMMLTWNEFAPQTFGMAEMTYQSALAAYMFMAVLVHTFYVLTVQKY